MKAILTGINGNLGKSIVNISDFEILKIGRDNWSELEQIKIGEYDVLIHCAYDLKKKFDEDPTEILNSNIISTSRALEICRDKKIKKFLFISSCSVYGESTNTFEDSVCIPKTLNGLTKLFNEKMISEFCLTQNFEYLILRAFNSYGGDDQFSVISKLLNAIKDKSAFVLVNKGLGERDFVHVEDLAKVVCFYTKNHSNYNIVNIGTGRATPIHKLVEIAKAKYPNLNIIEKNSDKEVDYSRARIKRFSEECHIQFRDVEGYLKEELNKC